MQQFQQFSRVCTLVDHDQMSIIYVCTYKDCRNRFMCSTCMLDQIHLHGQSDLKHILDKKRFCDKVRKQISTGQGKKVQNQYNHESINYLKQLIQEIQYRIKNINNIIQQIEQENIKDINDAGVEAFLVLISKNGVINIDDKQLDQLINMHKQQMYIDFQEQLKEQFNIIRQEAQKINQWSLEDIDQEKQYQKIIDAKYQIKEIDNTFGTHELIICGTISNNFKYIVSANNDFLLKIWNFDIHNHIKTIQLDNLTISCKFTDDSNLLYIGQKDGHLYQFDAQNSFTQTFKIKIHNDHINQIYCIENTIVLTSSCDNSISKTDINKNSQIYKILAHDNHIYGLDYNKDLQIVVSGSYDNSIKLWNGINGNLIIQKYDAHSNFKCQALLIINNTQLISQDTKHIIIWNINYQEGQLEEQLLIMEQCRNISLSLDHQFIIMIGQKYIQVYSITGKHIRSFDHDVKYFSRYFNTIQNSSLKAILILGMFQLQVCTIDLELMI